MVRAAPERTGPERTGPERTGPRRTGPERTAPPAARHPQRARRATAKPSAGASISERALAFVRTLPDHPLLDRIVRGRTWIALLGLMLVGIVAMQVEQLKLGASIGRSIQRTSRLQTHNEQLQASVASLSDERRIEAVAARQGMIMPPPTAIGFLSSPHQTDIRRALANIHASDPAAFSSSQTGNGAVVTSASINAFAPTSAGPASTSTSAPAAATTQTPAISAPVAVTQTPVAVTQTPVAATQTPVAATQTPVASGTDTSTQSAAGSGLSTPSGG